MRKKAFDFEPRTLGDHIRRRRLELGIGQKEVGKRIGVGQYTIINWEKGRTEPPISAVPGLVRFLGYDPFPESQTLPERMRAKRRAMGWSIQEAASQMGVDPATWGHWERGRIILLRKHRILVARLLGVPLE